MFKKILTLTLAAALFAGTSAMAQATTDTVTKCEKNCGRTCHKKQSNEFAGITLTPEQQAKIEAVKAEFRKDAKATKEGMRKAEAKGEKMAKRGEKQGEKFLDKAKDKGQQLVGQAKEQGEKVVGKTKEEVRKMKGEGRRDVNKAKRAEYLQKMKEILTPEQYTTYLENQAKATPMRRGDKHHGKMHKPEQAKKVEQKNS